MTSAPIRIPQPVLADRAASVARRLLTGAGRASFVAYRHDAQNAVAVPAHGLSATGDLVLAHLADDLPCDITQSTDVRVDIHREATDAAVRILAASAHMLGRIEWLSPAEVREALESGGLPEAVATVAEVPGAVLGVVVGERFLLHDAAGATAMDYGDLVPGQSPPVVCPGAQDEVDAQELVAALPSGSLHDLYAGVLTHTLPGFVLSERDTAPTCAASLGAIHCVDVDAHGLTLMHVGATSTSLIFVPFGEPAHDTAQLQRCLSGLLQLARL